MGSNRGLHLHLFTRVQWVLIDISVSSCAEEVQTAVITECPPLGVDNHLSRGVTVAIPGLHSVQLLHVTGIGAGAQDDPYTAVMVTESTGHEAAHSVIENSHTLHTSDVLQDQRSQGAGK